MSKENLDSAAADANFDICNPADIEFGIRERAERLRTAVRIAGGNQRVASRAGVPLGTLNRYLAGQDMKASVMIALARACSVSLDWLAEGLGSVDDPQFPASQRQENDATETASIKHIDMRASVLPGTFKAYFDSAPVFEVNSLFIKAAFPGVLTDLFMMRSMGDFMEPTLRPGEMLIFERTSLPYYDGIFAVIFSGIFMIRRLSVGKEGTLTLSADDTRAAPADHPIDRVRQELPGEDADFRNLFIVGRLAYRLQTML